jgi:nucleoside-diphosphate-sugar epimerase
LRIVVTGAAGFIGSHLAERLVVDGHDVVGVDGFIDTYPRSYKERNLEVLRDQQAFSFHALDLRADLLDEVLDGADAVVNLAAMPGLPRSWTDFDSYATNNFHAVQRLIEACHRRGVGRFVQASTSSVYGREAVGDETMPTRPVSPYGVTKLAAEHLLLAYMETLGIPVVILRYFSVYGPRQRPDMAYHIFSEALLDDRPLTVFGDGRQTRSITEVGDCVAGTVAAVTDGVPGEVYNIGGGQSIALLEALQILADVLGRRPRIEFQPARPGDQRDTAADTTKAHDAFGYSATIGPREGLARQAAWHVGLR